MSEEAVVSDDVRTDERWLGEPPLDDRQLPADFAALTAEFLGSESVETVGDWLAAVRQLSEGDSIDDGDLCRAYEETKHRAEIDGETQYFMCFYDALLKAEMDGSPTEIHTESPDGSVVEADATGGGDLEVTPADAVVSFGMSHDVEPPAEESPDAANVLQTMCPHVKAFPDRDAYEEWAEDVPAATIAMDVEGSLEVGRAFVGDA